MRLHKHPHETNHEEPPGAPLSDREVEIMRHIRGGLSTKEAATAMNVKFTTAREYRERAYAKLRAHNTAQAINAFAMTQIRGTK